MRLGFCLGLALLAGSVSAGPLPLTAPEAPFVRQTSISEVPAAPVKGILNADDLVFAFGNKKIIVDPSGTFTVMADSRKIASSYFSVSTPAKSWNVNSGKKVIGKYDGSGMSILSCTADAASGTVTIKGMLGFNKPGTPEKAYPWTRTFALTEDNKVLVTTAFDVPDPKTFKRKGGIFFTLTQTNDYTAKPVDRGDVRKWHFRTPDLTVNTMQPDDSIRIEIRSSMILQKNKTGKKTSIYLTPERPTWVFAIDPGKCAAARPHRPGGVDFKSSDDLTLPTAGKNLLANPYFAQGYAFVRDAKIGEWIRNTDELNLVEGQAKFGKNCLKAGMYFTQTIPADPGDYVFSVYVKGTGTLSLSAAGKAPWKNVVSKKFQIKSPDQWKRVELPFKIPRPDMLSITYSLNGEGLLDGLQLEKGTKATEFSAPAVTAHFVTTPENGFLESGKPMSGYLELSTLRKSVSGTAEVTIRNFFGETVRKQSFKYTFSKGQYPHQEVNLKGLPDGVYVVEVSYRDAAAKTGDKRIEHFRFSIMPFLKNSHFTSRIFGPMYGGGYDGMIKSISERYLKRWQQVGFGVYGHAASMTKEVSDRMKSYGVIPFDGACVGYSSSKNVAANFPKLEVPPGRFFFYVKDPGRWFRKAAVFPDYRLVGGWSEDYRQKFKEEVKKQLRKSAEKPVYRIGSEWAAEIKNDPHYPDLVAAFFEAVHELYPKALVAEAGGMNMFPHDGVRQVDDFLERYLKKGYKKPDFLMGHPYSGESGMPAVFENFKALLKVAEKHGMSDCLLAFPEGMHFYAHDIPEWGCSFMSAESWRLRGPFSYDLGWIERLSAAYYARFWLVHLTEFHRLWCVTSAMVNTNNFIMDSAFTPRTGQKIPNTLGILFPHPKRYIGDFSFAPETKCLIWEDHAGRPIAAVWHENAMINRGYAPSPMAQTSYRGAEYIDLMGTRRKPAVDGTFPVSPFPLFIRGRKGDCDAFVKALRRSYIPDSGVMPFHLSEKIGGDGTLELILKNNLAAAINGTLTVGTKAYRISIEPDRSRTIKAALPEALSDSAVKKIQVPLTWDDGRSVIRKKYSFRAFFVRPFKGDWEKIPSIRLTNRTKKRAKDDLEASFQLAWGKDRLHLRITVKDDKLVAGSGSRNRYDLDAAQVYIDALCTGRRSSKKGYDDDDYEYTLMPTQDGRKLEIFRQLSPFMQYTLGTAAPKDKTIVTEFGGTFTRTADGYIYQVAFPAPYVRPAELVPGWNLGFGLLVSDCDKKSGANQCLSLSTVPGKGCYNAPHTWPIAVFADR